MSLNFKSIFRLALIMCLLLVVGSLHAQTTAKGVVSDSNGESVIGATVVEKGNPQNATVTDFDGVEKEQDGRHLLHRYGYPGAGCQ